MIATPIVQNMIQCVSLLVITIAWRLFQQLQRPPRRLQQVPLQQLQQRLLRQQEQRPRQPPRLQFRQRRRNPFPKSMLTWQWVG